MALLCNETSLSMLLFFSNLMERAKDGDHEAIEDELDNKLYKGKSLNRDLYISAQLYSSSLP